MPCFINCNSIRADYLGVKLIYSMSDCSFHVNHFILETQVQMLYQVMQVTVSFHSQPLLLLSVFHLGNLKLCRKTNEEWQTPNNLIYSDNIEPTWVKHSFREWPMCRCQLTYVDTHVIQYPLCLLVFVSGYTTPHTPWQGDQLRKSTEALVRHSSSGTGLRLAVLHRVWQAEVACPAAGMTGWRGLSCSR